MAMVALASACVPTAWCQTPAEVSPGESATATVDYRRDIEPVLRTHCYECHGEQQQSNGLRLDRRDAARLGGHSQRPVLGGDLTTNELYRRVSSADATYRMPKGRAPLSAREIELVRAWVRVGTPWPASGEAAGASPEAAAPRRPQTWWEQVLVRWHGADRAVDAAIYFTERYRVAFYALIGVHLALLLVERGKRMQRAGHRWAVGRWRPLYAACAAFRPAHYLVGVLALSLYLLADTRRRELDEAFRKEVAAAHEINQLRTDLAAATSVGAVHVRAYGDPPTPIRPSHPRRLAGEYYRGNCERNANLFNGGNYRTATMRISLCDGQRRPLAAGDLVPPGELLVRFEIDRSPGTTDALFSTETMSAVFLSRELYKGVYEDLRDQPVMLIVVKPDWQWEAYFPIGSPPADGGPLKGQIYVYSGNVGSQQVRGERHYGIVYDLAFAEGRLTPASDLWMGSLLWNAQLAVPQPGKVPLDEWFDYRPIPEIAGENSTDPRLLGIEEHQRKRREQEAADRRESTAP